MIGKWITSKLMPCLMDVQLFQHPFVCVGMHHRVGGLPVNYTSAEHDTRSTQQNSFLRKEWWRTTGQKSWGIRTLLHKSSVMLTRLQFWEKQTFPLIHAVDKRYYASRLILPKPSCNQCDIFIKVFLYCFIFIYKVMVS